jgi:hypothetical protein
METDTCVKVKAMVLHSQGHVVKHGVESGVLFGVEFGVDFKFNIAHI